MGQLGDRAHSFSVLFIHHILRGVASVAAGSSLMQQPCFCSSYNRFDMSFSKRAPVIREGQAAVAIICLLFKTTLFWIRDVVEEKAPAL